MTEPRPCVHGLTYCLFCGWLGGRSKATASVRNPPEVYQVDTGYACAGVIVRDGIVISAAPIFHWMVGREWADVRAWRRICSVRTASDR